MKKLLAAALLSLSLVGCNGVSGSSIEHTKDVAKYDLSPIEIVKGESADMTKEIATFSAELLSEIYEGENTMISPLSIISALGMTANGASGQTLTEMEEIFGVSAQELTDYLYFYETYLPQGEKYSVSLANSLWLRDREGLSFGEDFLQDISTQYKAEIFTSPFDESTTEEINDWVEDKTDGMIDKVLDSPPPDAAVMYLINALSFDAQWADLYEKGQIRDNTFFAPNGEVTAEFMYSAESSYFETDYGIGFSKPYAEGKYSFVALLPNEDIKHTMANIDGATLIDAVRNSNNGMVYASIPKFSFDYSVELAQTLADMGMEIASDESLADFSKMATSDNGNIFISRVLHKTHISVDEAGTKAGAVTVVEATDGAAPAEPVEIVLDRPFLFMIVDNEYSLPLFMGCVVNPTE